MIETQSCFSCGLKDKFNQVSSSETNKTISSDMNESLSPTDHEPSMCNHCSQGHHKFRFRRKA